MKYNVGITINKPLADVFQFVTRAENESKWQAATVDNQQLTPGPMGVGVTMRHTGKWLGRKYQSEGRVTAYEPNHTWAYESVSGPFDLAMHFRFDPAETGTRLTMEVEGDAKGFFGFFKWAEPLMASAARRMLEDDLVRLKRVLESSA